jgi:hypothetical protein
VKFSLSLGVVPVINIPSDLVLSEAATPLDFSFELITSPGDYVQIIVGELSHFSLTLSLICFQFPSTRFQSIGCLDTCLTQRRSVLRGKSSALVEIDGDLDDLCPMSVSLGSPRRRPAFGSGYA